MADDNLRIGQYVVLRHSYSALSFNVRKVDQLTPKQIRTNYARSDKFMHADRAAVIASFESEKDASEFMQRLYGVRGEHDRRVHAAGEAAQATIARLVSEAREQGK